MANPGPNAQFQNWLLDRMLESDYSPMSLANGLGLLDGTIEDWVAGRSVPNLTECQRLAQLFEIPIQVVRMAAGW